MAEVRGAIKIFGEGTETRLLGVSHIASDITRNYDKRNTCQA